jgi:hypothetical protein
MDTLSPILQQFGKAGSIAALFSSTLGLFVFIENMSSTQARADFTKYLRSTDVTRSVIHLPEDTRALFRRLFGVRHFSLRCLIASVLFSIAVLVGLFVIAALHYLKTYFSLARDLWEKPAELWMFGVWVTWSVVPDYFNLLKTRKVLDILTARRIKRTSISIAILFADFVLGYVVFALTFFPVLVVGGLIGIAAAQTGLAGALESIPSIVNDVLANPSTYIALDTLNPFSTETPLSGELSPFFWASMVPSIWLWLYVAATLIVRSAPAFRFSMYLFDIDQHPIRSVGIVAATLVSGAYAMFLMISKFAQF